MSDVMRGHVEVIHILHHGQALCPVMGTPDTWPKFHRWVGRDELANAEPEKRCGPCFAAVAGVRGEVETMWKHPEPSKEATTKPGPTSLVHLRHWLGKAWCGTTEHMYRLTKDPEHSNCDQCVRLYAESPDDRCMCGPDPGGSDYCHLPEHEAIRDKRTKAPNQIMIEQMEARIQENIERHDQHLAAIASSLKEMHSKLDTLGSAGCATLKRLDRIASDTEPPIAKAIELMHMRIEELSLAIRRKR